MTLDKITANYCAGMQPLLSDRSRLRCDNLPADVQGADLREDLVQHVVGDQGERVAAALVAGRHTASHPLWGHQSV